MKNSGIAILLFLVLSVSCKAQITDQDAIKETVTAFSKAGDNNNVQALEKHLDQHYRVVLNRLFGSKTVGVVSKTQYLEKIKTKEWGGDSRNLTFEDIVINGTTASTKVTFKGKKATIVSIIILVKNEKGIWKLVSDIPIFK